MEVDPKFLESGFHRNPWALHRSPIPAPVLQTGRSCLRRVRARFRVRASAAPFLPGRTAASLTSRPWVQTPGEKTLVKFGASVQAILLGSLEHSATFSGLSYRGASGIREWPQDTELHN